MTNIKKQLKGREQGGWKRIEWSLVEPPKLWQLEVLQARIVAMDPKVDATSCCCLHLKPFNHQKSSQFYNAVSVVSSLEWPCTCNLPDTITFSKAPAPQERIGDHCLPSVDY